MKIAGEIIAEIVEVRFAYAGKVNWIGKNVGEEVKVGEGLAKLDTKAIQTELDRQLADYERARAEFDAFNSKNTNDSDLIKFARVERQAALNASVKEVELAKYKLDQATLLSPISGKIVDLGGMRVGMNVTPASSPIKILDNDSFRFTFTISQKLLDQFGVPRKLKITIDGIKEKIEATSLPPVVGRDGKFVISARFSEISKLLAGMKAEAELH